MHTLVKYLLPLLAVMSLCDALLRPSSPTYTRTDDATGEVLVCEKCAPGTYLIRHCTKDERTVCGPCPSRHFTEISNYIEKCLFCDAYCTGDQYEKVACTSTTNRQCACKHGFYTRHGSCYRHSKCPFGEGVVVKGTADTDVTCEPCPDGFFSSESSSTQTCQPFSVCPAGTTSIPGDDRHDVHCSKCKRDRTTPEDQEECDDDLVVYIGLQAQTMTDRKVKRLNTVLKRATKSRHENLSTRELLERIKRRHSQAFVRVIREILERAELPYLERKVNTYLKQFGMD